MCVATVSNGVPVYLSEITDEARVEFSRRMCEIIARRDGSYALTDKLAGTTQEFSKRGPAANALVQLQSQLRNALGFLMQNPPMDHTVVAARVKEAATLPITALEDSVKVAERVLAANDAQYVTRDRIAPWEILLAAYRKQLHIANGGECCYACDRPLTARDRGKGWPCGSCLALDDAEAEAERR